MTYAAMFSEAFPAAPDGRTAVDQASLGTFVRRLLPTTMSDADLPSHAQLFLSLVGEGTAELHARSRGWVVHLTRGVAQGAVLTTLLSVAIRAVTQADLSLVVIPAVLPLLFQVEKAELSLANEELLISLYRTAGGVPHTVEDLFRAIPEPFRDEVNRLDLLDFLEAVSLSGHAREVQHGYFELSHPDHPRLRVRIR